MLTLDFKNCLHNMVGQNGLKQSEFQAAIRKYQHLKKTDQYLKKWGFLDLPFQSATQITALEKEAAFIRKHFKNVLFIGIGGSALGAMALLKSLRPFYHQEPQLFFLDNPESEYVNFLLEHLDLKKTLLIPISKSGNTMESLAIFSIFYEKMTKIMGKKAGNQVIAITEKNQGTLYRFAKKERFKIYTIPENIGGRFSVFSNVGLLPSAIAGIDLKKLMAGAKKTNPDEAYLLALIQYLFYSKKNKTITVLFGYGRKLEGISDWYIQLLAESIGKTVKVGPTPLKAVGSIDQHSQLQLFMEGPNNKLIIFIESKTEKKLTIPNTFKNDAYANYIGGHDLHHLLLTERKATAEALAAKKRPNITISLPTTDENNIGQLLFMLELQIAFLGELFKINAFNQPGVELGKILTKKYLQHDKK